MSEQRRRLGRVWLWLEERYDHRRVWCSWCQDVPAAVERDGFCSTACERAYATFLEQLDRGPEC